jgi:hypothetical protein
LRLPKLKLIIDLLLMLTPSANTAANPMFMAVLPIATFLIALLPFCVH